MRSDKSAATATPASFALLQHVGCVMIVAGYLILAWSAASFSIASLWTRASACTADCLDRLAKDKGVLRILAILRRKTSRYHFGNVWSQSIQGTELVIDCMVHPAYLK
jgi:hypothetical protein